MDWKGNGLEGISRYYLSTCSKR